MLTACMEKYEWTSIAIQVKYLKYSCTNLQMQVLPHIYIIYKRSHMQHMHVYPPARVFSYIIYVRTHVRVQDFFM